MKAPTVVRLDQQASDGDRVAIITVQQSWAQVAAPPDVADLPADMRKALIEWLGATA